MVPLNKITHKYLDIIYVTIVLVIFVYKYYGKMLAANNFMQAGAWYNFLDIRRL